MHARKLQKNYTFQDYQKLEQQADIRHEYHDGEVYAMAGETVRHSRICTNLMVALGSRLKNSPCQVFGSSMKVRIQPPQFDKSLYPDLSISCDQRDKQDDKSSLESPSTIIEVLSKSTESYDRGDKFRFYRALPSLEHYLLINQNLQLVENYRKTGNDQWQLTLHQEDSINLLFPRISLAITDIYSGMT